MQEAEGQGGPTHPPHLPPSAHLLFCRRSNRGPRQRPQEEEGQGGGRHAQDARHDRGQGKGAQGLQAGVLQPGLF